MPDPTPTPTCCPNCGGAATRKDADLTVYACGCWHWTGSKDREPPRDSCRLIARLRADLEARDADVRAMAGVVVAARKLGHFGLIGDPDDDFMQAITSLYDALDNLPAPVLERARGIMEGGAGE